jgi:cation diffusion facilitator family transporter
MAAVRSTKVVIVSLVCNFGVAISKFAAALLTGSSAMLSEAIHSLVDTSSQGLLLHGIKRAARPPDARYPLGYGMELYFWSFVVAIVLFSLGAGVSIYEGVDKLSHPRPITNAEIAYAVLGVALIPASVSAWQALKALGKARNGASALVTLRRLKDPALFTVLVEQAAALAGLTVALIGISATHLLNVEWADGAASIAIGLILAAVAAFLSIEIKSLLIGEAASEDLKKGVRTLLGPVSGKSGPVRAINEIRAMQPGPKDVVIAVGVDMEGTASAADVEATNQLLSDIITAKYPEVQHVFTDIKASVPAATAKAATTPVSPSSSAHAKAGLPPGAQTPTAAEKPEAAAKPVKPTIAARPASARKGKGGKRRR